MRLFENFYSSFTHKKCRILYQCLLPHFRASYFKSHTAICSLTSRASSFENSLPKSSRESLLYLKKFLLETSNSSPFLQEALTFVEKLECIIPSHHLSISLFRKFNADTSSTKNLKRITSTQAPERNL